MTAFDAMSPEARRSWVATEIMGWHEEYGVWRDADGNGTAYTSNDKYVGNFLPDEDRNHTALMEDRLEEMGRGIEHANALLDIVYERRPTAEEFSLKKTVRDVIRLSASDRVRAAYAVIGEKNQ